MNYRSARRDVLDYLASQDDAYFEERETTREAVLRNKVLIEEIALEHMKCVNDFGCEREWSCKDACDSDPGIAASDEEITDSLEARLESAVVRSVEDGSAENRAVVQENIKE